MSLIESFLDTARWFRARVFRHYTLNNGRHWDAYALYWTLSGNQKRFEYLGDEWGHQEGFLSVLEEHSVGRGEALEIGCGGGRITSKAIDWFDRVHAADVSSRMLDFSRKALGRSPKVMFHKIDGFTLAGFEDDSQDLVYSHDVFVHFSSLQIYSYLQEIGRVLKPGGVVVLSFYDFMGDFDLFAELANRYRDERRFPPHMRIHFVTEEMIRAMLNKAGLQPVSIDKGAFLIAVGRKPQG